jgi:hypothetical protein
MLCGGGYEHRRDWIQRRLRQLASIFAIDVVSFAVMSNHLHVLVWTDPQRSLAWSNQEVARRWLGLFPNAVPAGHVSDLDRAASLLATDKPRISLLRQRLSDLSWFMKCLKEPIARRANREDGCTGAFWEGRFKSYRVTDDAGALTCSVYIDLNAIHAGLAQTPEGSNFTSVQERIRHRQAVARQRRRVTPPTQRSRRDRRVKVRRPKHADIELWLTPFGSEGAGARRRVLFGFGADQYLQLVDAVGRVARGDKRGMIPSHLRPILERLEIEIGDWLHVVTDGVRRLWGTTVGTLSSLAEEAARRGRSRVVSPFGPVA